jgi:hypothetical protein
MFGMLQVATVLRLVPGPWTKALDALGPWVARRGYCLKLLQMSGFDKYNLNFLRQQRP